jgi:hypothetical protein
MELLNTVTISLEEYSRMRDELIKANNENIFRCGWNGLEVEERRLSKYTLNYPFVLFFEKPKKFVWVNNGTTCYYFDEKVKLGEVIYLCKSETEKIEIKKKIQDYFNSTYKDYESCLLDNEISVCDFEGEEEKQTEKDFVYIEFVGLVSKETAKAIANELKLKKIK